MVPGPPQKKCQTHASGRPRCKEKDTFLHFFCQKIWSKRVDAVETSKTHHQKNLTPRGFKKPLNHPRVETGKFSTLCPLHICWRRRELCQQAQWYILTRPANVGFFVDITGWVDMFTGEECTLGGGAVN